MKSLEANRLQVLRISGEDMREIGQVHYHRGRQAVYAAAHRDLLEDLRQATITQGTRASNGIEGIVLPDERYQAVVFNNETPLTLHEQAVVGYRDALEYIHLYHDRLDLTPETIKDFHRRIYMHIPGYPSGTFRQELNEVVRTYPDGREEVVYTPPPHPFVEKLVVGLCTEYRRHLADARTDRFLLLAAFVFDFTCIHPFMNGNGRVSRLLTNLLAYKLGFEFVRYIPHERIVFETKDSYYAALTNSSAGWLRDQHNWTPWLRYLAMVFARAGAEMEERLAATKGGKGYKSDRIRDVIQNLPSQFTIRDIIKVLPQTPRPTIMYVLNEERQAGRIEGIGRGPKAGYRKVSVMDHPRPFGDV
jgi:Fic family protein